ncbi:MAG: asparagine synthase-related protein, partial [Candidatus Binatia bacterium]
GMKPFYYYADDRVFLWGSELRPLFEYTAVPREPNDGMVGEYLASAITNKEETLFRSVFRLPPAHFLVVQPGHRLQKERYWDIDTAKEIRYPTDIEYAEHFSEIFKEAVRCRLRSHKPVGVYLSGGLDSSSVVGMAQSLYRDGALADARFEAFSLVFPEQSCDESTYIEDVVRFWDIKSNALCPKPPDHFWHAQQVTRYYDIPDYPNSSMCDPLAILAQENGFRVLLTGLGGDEWFSGSRYHYADLLRKLRIRSLIRKARSDCTVPGVLPLPSHPVVTWGVKPLIPNTIRRVARRLRRRNGVPDWIDSQFSHNIHLPERLSVETDWSRFSNFAQGDHYISATSGWQTHGIEMEERSESWFAIESRHPFDDRRVVEFGLALPEEQRWRGDQRKFILRQAMGNYLPKSVRQRLTKAEFSPVFAKALHAQDGERFFDALSIGSERWIDEKQIRQMYRQMAQLYRKGDKGYLKLVWPLWSIFGIEMWFNTVFNGRKIFQLEQLVSGE